jgi:hypothetical protein
MSLERFPRHAMLFHAEQARRQDSENDTNAASTPYDPLPSWTE